MADIRLINDYDYNLVLRRRIFTIRRTLRQRIQDDDVPEYDDPMVREVRTLEKLIKLHPINAG